MYKIDILQNKETRDAYKRLTGLADTVVPVKLISVDALQKDGTNTLGSLYSRCQLLFIFITKLRFQTTIFGLPSRDILPGVNVPKSELYLSLLSSTKKTLISSFQKNLKVHSKS